LNTKCAFCVKTDGASWRWVGRLCEELQSPMPKREKMCLPFIMSTAQRNCIKARSRGLTLALPYTCWQHCPSRDSHSPRRYHNFMGCQLKFYSLRGRCSNECGFRIVEKCQLRNRLFFSPSPDRKFLQTFAFSVGCGLFRPRSGGGKVGEKLSLARRTGIFQTNTRFLDYGPAWLEF
jgi:hypothetical protein